MIEMETFKRAKNVLCKCFIISFIIWLILMVSCYLFPQAIFKFCAAMHHVTLDQSTMKVLSLFNMITVVTIFLFLIPAIAIGWERACFANKAKKEVESEVGL